MTTTIKIQIKDNETGKLVYPTIKAEKIVIAGFESISLAVHKKYSGEGYAVTETTTGLQIASESGKAITIKSAKAKMQHVGIERVQQVIAATNKIPCSVTYNACRNRTA